MISLRSLTTQEIPETVEMMITFYSIDGYPINPKKTEELFKEFIHKPELGKCFVITYDEVICGYTLLISFFSFEMAGYVLLLDELYISSEFQGKGIGKKAMEFIKRYAADHQFKKLVLEVEPHNQRAIHLYEKENFRKHQRDLMIFP